MYLCIQCVLLFIYINNNLEIQIIINTNVSYNLDIIIIH